MHIRRSFWFFLGMVIISAVVALYAGRYSTFPESRIVFYRLSLLGALLITVNWIWTYFATRRIMVKRNQRVLRLPVGNVFEERFDILNQSKFWRLWVEIEDLSNLPGNSGSKVLSQINPRQDRFYVSRTLLLKRGSYHLSPTLLRSGDPFGMFISEKVFEENKTLVVLPYLEELEQIKQKAGLFIGGEAVRQKSLEATSHAAGVRDYQPGDPLNRIHWRSSAKRNRFMVKEFDQDPQGDIWILLDCYEKFQYEMPLNEKEVIADSFWAWKNLDKFKLPPSTFEYATSISATLANYFTKTEKSVGLASADRRMVVVPSEKGERQFGKIMDTLAFLEGKGQLPLNGLIESISSQIPRGSTVVLVSSGTISSMQVGFEILMRKRLNPVLVLLDPISFGADPDEGNDQLLLAGTPFPSVTIQYGDSIRERLKTLFR